MPSYNSLPENSARERKGGKNFFASATKHQTAFSDACEADHLKDVTLRGRKRCAVTEMRCAGLPDHLVSSAADHAKSYITGRYTNLTDEHVLKFGQRARYNPDTGLIEPVDTDAVRDTNMTPSQGGWTADILGEMTERPKVADC